jgi:hypothetical protein
MNWVMSWVCRRRSLNAVHSSLDSQLAATLSCSRSSSSYRRLDLLWATPPPAQPRVVGHESHDLERLPGVSQISVREEGRAAEKDGT